MNCTVRYFSDNASYRYFQITMLLLMLIVIILLNSLALYFTYHTKYTRECPLSRVLSASFVGNIIAGTSLFAGSLGSANKGEANIGCSQTADRHFFFYLGISVNMCILVMNTYVRYRMIKKFQVPHSNVTILIRFILPSWFFSALIAFVAVIIQMYTSDYFQITSLVIMVPMLMFVIICNFRLTRVLVRGRENSRNINQPNSEEKIDRASSTVKRIAYTQAAYLAIWIVIVIVTLKVKHRRLLYIVILWITRVVFFLSFVLEAKIFLHKFPEVREAICSSFKRMIWFKSSSEDSGTQYTISSTVTIDSPPSTNKSTHRTLTNLRTNGMV